MHISCGLRTAGGCVGLQQLYEGSSCVESSVVALASWTGASEVLGHRLLPSHCLAAFSVLPLVHVLLWCQLPVPLWEGAAALCHVWGHCRWRVLGLPAALGVVSPVWSSVLTRLGSWLVPKAFAVKFSVSYNPVFPSA